MPQRGRGAVCQYGDRVYNRRMKKAEFERLKRFVQFGHDDIANLKGAARYIEPLFPRIIERFYKEVLADPRARLVFTGGEEQLERQRAMLAEWLKDLFSGDYSNAFLEKQDRIGVAHVRGDVPQHYMVVGMEVVWQELVLSARAAGIPGVDDKLRSIHKLLLLDLATMLDSYKERYSEEVRMTERSVVEEKLTRAEHLAEIGQLAASLAHEIKNPLAGISGAIQIIREALAPDHPHQPIVTEILGQIKRLDATVKDLLQYARPTPPQWNAVPLDAVVQRVLSVLQEEPAIQRVNVQVTPPPPSVVVRADDVQIEQLLINLILNAAQASEPGDTVCVSVTDGADRVRLTVSDTGQGMSSNAREHAFEPFFTTKAKGTGLGLSICRRIAETHGGNIRLTSEHGKGTSVTVELPRHGKGRAGKEDG